MTADDSFQRLQRLSEAPLTQDFFHHVESLSRFDMPPSSKSLFTAYHSHFFDAPRPAFSADWGESSPNWRWQKRHSEAVLGSTQAAFTGVYYHRDNLLRIERDILAFPRMQELMALVGNSAIGGGNTQKLDFEYHAFIFAYRRSLDYLARAIASLLKQEFHSFRELPVSLKAHAQHEWDQRIIDIHRKYAPRLGSFLSKSEEKSTRDLIAHYMHVPAGCLNVNATGIFLAGGGEKLSSENTLGSVIHSYVQTLEDIVKETFDAVKSGFPKDA
jgi:hypothetical protein